MASQALMEFGRRKKMLANLSSSQAGNRLAGLLVWLESEPLTREVIEGLNKVNVNSLVRNCPDSPPDTKTPEEITAFAVRVMQHCRDGVSPLELRELYGIYSNALTEPIQATVDEIVRSYIVPALEYIGDELHSKESQHSTATKTTDIFISHADIERAVALELQSFFQNAFGNHCGVFVSSDEKSMEPGDWFTHIVQSLKSSKVFVVLISKYSFQREWINYETGIAEGSSTWVDASGLAKNIFPIVIRGFPKGAGSWPLSHYQIKDLHGEGEVRWILEHIAKIVGLEVQKTSISEFIQKITNVEKRLPTRGIQLRPFVSKAHPHIVNFELRNGGTTDYELVEVWVAVLQRLVPNHNYRQVPPAFVVSEVLIDGELYLKKRLIVCTDALDPNHERSDFERLRPLFVPSMSPKHLPDLLFPVNQNLTEDDRTNPLIQFQIAARNLSAEEGRVFHVSLAEIERDS